MSRFSTDSSINSEPLSPRQLDPRPVPSLSSLRLGVFTDDLDLSFGSESERSQDSVAKRRRHGVYFHRPPVWCPGPCPHNNPPVAMRGCSFPCMFIQGNICDDTDCIEGAPRQQKCLLCPTCTTDVKSCTDRYVPREFSEASVGDEEANPWATDLYCEMTAATIDARVDTEAVVSNPTSDDPLLTGSLNSHLTASNQNSRYRRLKVSSALASEAAMNSSDYQSSLGEISPSPPFVHHYFRQTKPGLCTRLQLYKDVRLGVGEKWAIQEGSLVVCIDPSYTRFDRKEGFSDEFELANGDFYIVCRLYADLWALCAKVSFDSRAGSYCHDSTGGSMNPGFLPLCAVTLAANLSAFVRRCFKYANFPPSDARYPGNGLPVIPPERSHSVNASKQIFQGGGNIELPSMVHSPYSSLSLEGIDMDFIPLDSTLQQLFSKFGSRRERVHQLRSRMSHRNIWHGMRSSEQHLEMGSSVFPSTNHVAFASLQSQPGTSQKYDGRRRSHLRVGSATSIGQGWRRLTRMPAREVNNGRGQNIRSFIFGGSERWTGSWRSNSEL